VALTHVAVTALWGGLMALERRAFLQAMVSRPLVAGTVTGLLAEDALAGLFVGLLFELLHAGGASLGGAHADHDTLPAVAGAALASGIDGVVGGQGAPAVWALAVLVCAPLGRLGLRLEHRLDVRARKYYGRALTAADAGNLRRVARQNLRALWPQFTLAAVVCGVAALVAPLVGQLYLRLPPGVVRGLGWAFPAMAAAAAAVAVRGSHSLQRGRLAAAGAVVAAVAWWWTRGGAP
jgi:PTS system mannose-specific IIC component